MFPTKENKNTDTNSLNRGKNFFQPKLSVNQPGDSFEQEADTMADRVMRMGIPSNGRVPFFKPASNVVQRKCQHCEEEDKFVHRKESSDGEVNGNSELDNYIGSLGSSGQPLPAPSRSFFEPRFGHDFSNVRVHTDTTAAKSAQSINALAYTTGNNIVFNSGQFLPESDSGKRLIAHELTHVVQQGNSGKIIQKAPDKQIQTQTAGNSQLQVPALVSGSVSITFSPLEIKEQNVSMSAMTANFKITKPFTVKSSAKISEPSLGEPWEYGLVQNLLFEHIEAAYTDGDILIDILGANPLLDVDPGNPSEHPFTGPPKMASRVFMLPGVDPEFYDAPFVEFNEKMFHCNGKKLVDLVSVHASNLFTVGLVARGMSTKKLVQLGTIKGTYGSRWYIVFTGKSFNATEIGKPVSQFALTADTNNIITTGAIANVEGQKKLNAEISAFGNRCNNILP